MPNSPTPPRATPPRRRPAPFRPRFSIGILYLVAFFFLICFLQVLPELVDLLALEPGEDQQQRAEAITRETIDPLLSLLFALAATSLGAYYQVLPGMGES